MKLFLIGIVLLGASYMVRGMRDRQMAEADELLRLEIEEISLLPKGESISEWLLGTAAEKTDAAYVRAERYDDLMTATMWAGIACIIGATFSRVAAGVTGFVKMREQSRVEIERLRHQETAPRVRVVESRPVEEPTEKALAVTPFPNKWWLEHKE